MDDICTEKSIKISEVSREQLAALCFTIIPDSQGNRIRQAIASIKDLDQVEKINEKLKNAPPSTPTLLHKLTVKNPEEIKPLIARMRYEWP